MTTKRCIATHGIVCRLPDEMFGYFGWPSVARLDDGTLLVASSGLRIAHVCPFGKTVLNSSTDNGRTWSAPRVIQDSMIDDRDAGIVHLGGSKLVVTWFRSDTRKIAPHVDKWPAAEQEAFAAKVRCWTDAEVAALLGSWLMLSHDGGASWSEPIRVPVTAPHGPICLRSGELLYLGKQYEAWADLKERRIAAARSADGGRTWKTIGEVPLAPATAAVNYHEPHVVELLSGRLLGLIRVQAHGSQELKAAGTPDKSMMQTESDDGGRTWTVPRPLGFHGLPPHLLRHSSGTLILTYGYRQEPRGVRVAFSHDEGATWAHDWILRDDAPPDNGYPATVELDDTSLFTVYYQKAATDEKCALCWSRWDGPGK